MFLKIQKESPGHCFGNLGSRDDRRDRKSVSHSLGHRHDVGHDPVTLEAPEVFPGTPESGLNLEKID